MAWSPGTFPSGASRAWGGRDRRPAPPCSPGGTVYTTGVSPAVPPLATATAAMAISAVALAPFAAVTGFPLPGPATALWLIVLAVVATGGALVLFYALIHRAGALRASLAGYLAPAFAVGYGSAFLHEQIHPQTIAGLALILAGSYLAVR